MPLPKLLAVDQYRIFLTVLLVGLAAVAWPDTLTGPQAILTVLVSFLASAFLHYWIRRYYFGRLIAFDMGGPLMLGVWNTDSVSEVPGIRQLVARLRKKYIVVVLSNNNELARHGINRRFGFDSLFDEVIYSSLVRSAKPDPKIFQYLLRRYSISPRRVVFIDDDANNLAGAKSVGIPGIQFHGGQQSIAWLEAELKKHGISAR